MSKPKASARRVRVERNIYRRPTGKFEVGYKDGAGVQRWRTVDGGIAAARAARDKLLALHGHGERVVPNPRLRFAEAAQPYLADVPAVSEEPGRHRATNQACQDLMLRLQMSLTDAERFSERLLVERSGASAAMLRDVLWLRVVLIEQWRRVSLDERRAFERRADRILAALWVSASPRYLRPGPRIP
jgi:hypothetical protein